MNTTSLSNAISKIKFKNTGNLFSIINPFQKTSAICETFLFPDKIKTAIDGISAHIIEHNIIDTLCRKPSGRKGIEELGGLMGGFTSSCSMQFYIQTLSQNLNKIENEVQSILKNPDRLFTNKNFNEIKIEKTNMTIEKTVEARLFDNIFYPVFYNHKPFTKKILKNFYDQYITNSKLIRVISTPKLYHSVKPNQISKQETKFEFPMQYDIQHKCMFVKSKSKPEIILIYLTPKLKSIKEEVALDVFSRILNLFFKLNEPIFSVNTKLVSNNISLLIRGISNHEHLLALFQKNILKMSKKFLNKKNLDIAVDEVIFSLKNVISDPLSLSKLYSGGIIRWNDKSWLIDYVNLLSCIQLDEIREIIKILSNEKTFTRYLQSSTNCKKEIEFISFKFLNSLL